MPEQRILTLYARRRCHLCEQMRAALLPWEARLGFSVRVVDIETDPVLVDRHAIRIPVLAEGEREICHYLLDESALERHFADVAEG